MISCSIVVPVHNEGENIEKFVVQFWNKLKKLQANVIEIHLIENGSKDDSYQVCKKLESKFPGLIRVQQIPFPSYGEAIRQGIIKSTGDVTCILECDAMNVEFLSLALSILEQKKADFVLASKRHQESVDMRPFKRRLLTLLFNLWLKIFFDFPGTDTHGLKAIRSNVAKTLCRLSMTGDEVFQSEIVLLAYKIGYKVEEVPIQLEEERSTNVSIHRRLPRVIHVISDLKRSLNRF